MTWNEFFQSVKAGKTERAYLFIGPEELIKREALQALRDSLLPPGLEQLNDASLEGITARQIIDAAETMPMMCDRRIVTIFDWAPLLSGKSKNEEAEMETIQKWLQNPPDSCVVVFYTRTDPDGRKKSVTAFKKLLSVVTFDYLSDSELLKWSSSRIKPRGKKISSQAVNTLAFMAGRDLTRLSGELDKLTAYVGDKPEISEEDVRAIVPASLEYNVYELLNRLLEANLSEARQMTNSLLQNGQNPIGILAMLTRQLRQLAHMRLSLDAGEPTQRVQEYLQINPYAVRHISRQCKQRSAKVFQELYETCVEFDYDIKSGKLRDSDALESIQFKIVSSKLAQKRN